MIASITPPKIKRGPVNFPTFTPTKKRIAPTKITINDAPLLRISRNPKFEPYIEELDL